MPKMLRPRHETPTPLVRVTVPLALTALATIWAAAAITQKSWIFALVVAVVGVADLPLISRTWMRRGWLPALVGHAGVVLLGWFVAFLVWAPFVYWE
jgi:hypothetical protein